MNNIILGAGMTGLAAGYKTGWPVYEATDKAGGICRSYYKEGFKFDVGGTHWIFGNGEAVDFIKSLVPLKTYERKAGVYFNKIFPYPIQTYTQKEIVATEGYFKHWLGNKFSPAECNMFFNPFNEKYTAGLYDEIIQFDAYKTPPPGTEGYVPVFHDPVDGLDSLVGKLTSKCKINFNNRAVAIDTLKKQIIFHVGDEESLEWVKYDKLVSTIPLDMLLKFCGKEDYDLPYSSVLVLNIGAKPGRNLPQEHWLYIPFCKTGFYRVGFYTNVDNTRAPSGMVGLCVEMAFRGVEYEELDIDYITYHVTQELQSWGWIGDVVTTDPTWVPCAYTWNRTNEEREKHLEWLKERDIISIGRYGLWKFQGLAESIQQGLACA